MYVGSNPLTSQALASVMAARQGGFLRNEAVGLLKLKDFKLRVTRKPLDY